MTPEQMQSELTRLLESWNGFRSQYNSLRMDDLIIERMKGMLELAYHLKIINEAEKSELEYIYFNEESDDNEPTG